MWASEISSDHETIASMFLSSVFARENVERSNSCHIISEPFINSLEKHFNELNIFIDTYPTQVHILLVPDKIQEFFFNFFLFGEKKLDFNLDRDFSILEGNVWITKINH
jgi:hypothetical protein